MPAAEANHAPGRPRPVDGLESPFLDHELDAGADREEWAAHLGGLEAESPFASGFVPGGVGVVEPEAEHEDADKPCTGIIGNDDRRPVRQAWDVPYRWICQISATRRKGGRRLKFGPVGTGILISPRFVLTAAHLLRDSEKDDRGQWVDSETESVVVTPARNDNAPAGRTAPFGRFEARGWRFCPKYKPRASDAWKYDYALIELKEPAGATHAPVLNNQPLCFWGSRECGGNTADLQVLAATQLAGRTAYTAGYPADLGGGTKLYVTSGMLSGVDIRGRAEIMNYDADGCPGQSGSPIWIERDGQRYLAGIFTKVGTGHDAATGTVTLNNAVRLTQDVFDQISHWFEAVLETPWLGEQESEQGQTEGLASEEERGDDPEIIQFEDESGEEESGPYDTPVSVEHDAPTTPARRVVVGQRVELDLTKTALGADLDRVRWTIPGRVVGGYDASVNEAKLIELAPADLERPKISFFWVDAGAGKTVRATIRRKSGTEVEFVQVFDVEGPTIDRFLGKPGISRIERDHGTVGMRFGKLFEAPGINWTWKITMPPHHGGFIKDVQTLVANRSKIQRLKPGGSAMRTLVRRHPSKPDPHVQLDGDADNQPIYTPGLAEEKIAAGESRDNGTGTSDSPFVNLASLDKTVTVNDQFTYYLMFKPETTPSQDAIWVPVAKAKWSWRATADQRDKKWSIRKAPKMEPAVNMATVDFPLYQSNAAENEWQEAPPASSHEDVAGREAAGEEWTTETPDDDNDAPPPAYDTPEPEAWSPPADDGTLFENQAGGAPSWSAGIDPFPATPTVAFYVNEPHMLAAFAPVTASPSNHLCAALVDLTGNPAMPPYAGLNDDEMVFAGSMVKICAMYAAFALRAQVQTFVSAAAAHGAPVVPPTITAEIEKAWRPTLHACFPTSPSQSFGNKQDITFPRLETIFTFAPDGTVDFARATPALTNAALDRAGEFGVPPGRFHDWMRLMMRWSNNTAASHCILALGYYYINGALAQAGFFDAALANGLWLSADYAKHDWVSTLAEKNTNAAGQPLTPRWATAQRRRKSNVTATAAQTARLMTLMAQDKLVDATASQEMRVLMQTAIECTPGGKCGIGSYVKDALVRAGRSFTALAAKKGYGDDAFSHECAIIERTVAGKPLRYVVVGLGSAPGRKRRDLSELFVLLDDAIVTRNR